MTLHQKLKQNPEFDGETYSPERDKIRLTGQLLRVFDVMKDGKWRSFSEIRTMIAFYAGKYDAETSISARLRDLRKPKFGGYTVERKNIGGGLWKYRVR